MDHAAFEASLVERVATATAAMNITGGGTRQFFYAEQACDALALADYTGVVDYEPTELVITVRAGTRLRDLKALL
ncbi:MAG: glycolate oxidase subunit GlcE, partial [Gammaproteobacteria bacterium]|nr:glycolate oxidase subunit GlcE [Gammaproteobacteria bacterium]